MEKLIFLSVDGLKIEAEKFGNSDHAVILAHGKAFNMQSWEDFAIYLQKSGFTAIPFNFRGYGNSESKDTKYELDIAGIIKTLLKDYKHVSLIGASMGGAAALRSLEISEPIDGLVLLSPAGLPDDFAKLKGKVRKSLVVFSKGDFVFEVAEKIAESLPFDTEKVVFDGNLHAQNLFRDPKIKAELESKIVKFLKSAAEKK